MPSLEKFGIIEILGKTSYYNSENFWQLTEKLILKQDMDKQATAQRLKERVGGILAFIYGEGCYDVRTEA